MEIREFVKDSLKGFYERMPVIASVEDVTWSDLVDLRNKKSLIPGNQYRITDYVASTVQEDTKSAGHQFDIIVTALSKDTLSEEAKAIQHKGDTYFKDCNLNAWKIWYSLDNDTNRFAWAKDLLSPETNNKIITVERNEGAPPDIFVRCPNLDDENGKAWCYDYQSRDAAGDIYNYANNGVEDINSSDILYFNEYPGEGDYDSTETYTIYETSWGTGVIYRMIDEWNNDCPYDFKNIQFKRYKITACPKAPSLVSQYSVNGINGITVDTSTTYWCYTFTWINENDEIKDLSIVGQTLQTDENQYEGVFDNKIESFSSYELYSDNPSSFTFALSNNCFISRYAYDSGMFYGCYSNRFGSNCYSNTFGDNCNYNIFGYNCHSNIFGTQCTCNTFKNRCYLNILEKKCNRNNFENYCYSNILGDQCDHNNFGNSCYSNTLGTQCRQNTFKSGCGSNTLGDYCNTNTFGTQCTSNVFGNQCNSNIFGNSCSSNTLGDYCNSNIFENSCGHIIFNKNYVRYVIVENGNKYITLTTSGTTSSSNILKNVTIAQGVNSVNTMKTISHNTLNDEFKTTYQSANSQVINIII